MSSDKIFEDICIAFVKLDNFKYTYREFQEFYQKIKKIQKEKKKAEKNKIKNGKNNLELEEYKKFIIYYRNKGEDIKTTLELWSKHINKLKLIKN